MYPTSADYKTAIAASVKDGQAVNGTITLTDGTVIVIEDSDIIAGSLYLSEQCVTGEDIDVGNVYASEIGLTLITPTVNPYSLAGARVFLNYGIVTGEEEDGVQVWEFVPLGYFYVTDIQRKATNVEIKALDGMILLDIPLGVTTTSGYAYDLVSSCCASAGVTLGMVQSDFEDFPNYNLSVELPAESNVKTCRDLLMWVCQLLGCFARINRIGELELVRLNSAPVRTIGASERATGAHVSDNLVSITKAIMPVNGVEYVSGTDGMTMTLDENPLLQGADAATIQAALDAILAEVALAEYTPVDFDCFGDPSLQAGDYVTLTNSGALEGDPVALITHSTWRFRGKHKLRAAGKSALLRSDYQRSQIQKALSTVTATANSANSYAQAANHAALLLNSAIGGNVLIRSTEDGENEILIMDSTDPETAVKMWRYNINGWGYSNNCTGADNPDREYTIMGTMDGVLTANKTIAAEGTFLALTAGVVGAQRIDMGEDVNHDPFIRVYDDNNVLQISITKSGIVFTEDARMVKYTIGTRSGVGVFVA